MPCSSSEGQGLYYAGSHPSNEEFTRVCHELNIVTDILCRLIQNPTAVNNDDIRQWVEKHKRYDESQGRKWQSDKKSS